MFWVFVFSSLLPPAWPLAPASSPGFQLVFTGLDPPTSMAPNLYLPVLGPKFLFTGSGLQFLLPVWSLSLYIPTLSPQFVFLGPCTRFELPIRNVKIAFIYLLVAVAVVVAILAVVVISLE